MSAARADEAAAGERVLFEARVSPPQIAQQRAAAVFMLWFPFTFAIRA